MQKKQGAKGKQEGGFCGLLPMFLGGLEGGGGGKRGPPQYCQRDGIVANPEDFNRSADYRRIRRAELKRQRAGGSIFFFFFFFFFLVLRVTEALQNENDAKEKNNSVVFFGASQRV